MATKIEIEVTDDNTFNLGWLLYLLGQDRPDPGEPDAEGFVYDHASEGWDMGKDTGQALAQVRAVFTLQPSLDRPQYIITVDVPVTVNDQNVVVVAPDKPKTVRIEG